MAVGTDNQCKRCPWPFFLAMFLTVLVWRAFTTFLFDLVREATPLSASSVAASAMMPSDSVMSGVSFASTKMSFSVGLRGLGCLKSSFWVSVLLNFFVFQSKGVVGIGSIDWMLFTGFGVLVLSKVLISGSIKS